MESYQPSDAGLSDGPALKIGLIVRLSIMMFLQYFVWGIWLPMLYQFLGPNNLKLTEREIGWIFTVYGLGAIAGPFLFGQLADRYFATEKLMGVTHLFGGLLLIATAYPQAFSEALGVRPFWPIFILLLVYCSLYMPTMGLSNSITFRSLGDEGRNFFPIVRLWGTIGWIAAGLSFALYLGSKEFAPLRPVFEAVGEPSFRDCLRVAGVVSFLYAIYCFFGLPHTPPIPAKETDPIDKKSAILECLELMRNRSFAILILVSAVIGIMLAFYFEKENPFLEYIGTDPTKIGAFMTIGQIAELLVMLAVPLAVTKLGYKWTMIIGAGAWALRFGLSMIGYPWWLMIASIGLHGFCFGFFFVAAQMFVDRAASVDIKASAQNLFIFVVYGFGTVVGSVLGGELGHAFGSNWAAIWAGPFVLTILCIIAFALLFREQDDIRKPAAQPDEALV
jgi:nucleoside transporter